jgi:predicted TIM-barrel fold metal-dependent hydrolase
MEILDVNTIFGSFPTHHSSSDPQSLISLMDRHGVQRAFTLSSLGLFYNDVAGNDETLRHAKSRSDRLIPVATINPMGRLSGIEQFADEVASLPVALCRFFPTIQEWPIDYAPFTRALGRLLANKKPVMVSIGSQLGAITALSRLLDGTTSPVVLSRVQGPTLIEAIAAMQSHPCLLLETHSLQIPDGLSRVKDIVGADRIVFGSGAASRSLGAPLSYVQKSSLTDAEKAAVLGGNARRLLLEGN